MSKILNSSPFKGRFRAVKSHYHPFNQIFHAFGGMSCFFFAYYESIRMKYQIK